MSARPSTPDRLGGRIWIVVPLAAMLLYAVALVVEYQGANLVPGRLLSDPFDTGIYWERAQFYPTGKTPYTEVFSEYPALATLSFAIPLIAEPDLEERPYQHAWRLLMTVPFLALLLVIRRARRDASLAAWPIALMASPTLLYFSLNRFDILPTLLCAASLLLFGRGRYVSATVLLGIGVHVKWYPAVIFPVYLAYHMEAEGLFASRLRGLWRSQSLRLALVFLGTVLLLVLLSVLAFGWDGFMTPYRFHGNRGGQYFNPYWLMRGWLEQHGWTREALDAGMNVAFLAAQVSILGILLVKRIRSFRQVQQYAVLAIVIFITFAKVDSPQWVLWYVPLALLFVRRADTIAWMALLTVLNYAVFPVAFDHLEFLLGEWGTRTPERTVFSWLVFSKDLALLAMLWTLMTREGDVA